MPYLLEILVNGCFKVTGYCWDQNHLSSTFVILKEPHPISLQGAVYINYIYMGGRLQYKILDILTQPHISGQFALIKQMEKSTYSQMITTISMQDTHKLHIFIFY